MVFCPTKCLSIFVYFLLMLLPAEAQHYFCVFLTMQRTNRRPYPDLTGDLTPQAVVEEQRRDLPREHGSTRQGHQLTWTAYHRLADHYQYMEYVAHTHPQLCRSLSIGTSSQGRELRIVQCGTGARGVWIDGGG